MRTTTIKSSLVNLYGDFFARNRSFAKKEVALDSNADDFGLDSTLNHICVRRCPDKTLRGHSVVDIKYFI